MLGESPDASDAREDGPSDAPLVVGVGASAGGLEALKELFAHTPPGTGAAFVVVHAAPESLRLADLLEGHTQLAVRQASSGLRIRPDTVYLVPPRRSVRLVRRVMELDTWEDERDALRPIDGFLSRLAETERQRAIAVVLSGSGTDGTLGAEHVKAAGGRVLTQDGRSARFDDMPGSVARAGHADFTSRPAAIARRVAELVRATRAVEDGETTAGGDAPPAADAGDADAPDAAARIAQAMLESSRDVFWMARSDTLETLYVSDAYERVWGRTAQDVRAGGPGHIGAIHPSDRWRVKDAYRSLREGIADIEYRIVRSDGELRWIRDRAFPVLEEGRVVYIAGLAADISEEVAEAHAREDALVMFKGAFDHARVGIVFADGAGVLTRVNGALCELIGREASTIVGRDLFAIVHPDDRAGVEECLRRVFSEQRVAECECRLDTGARHIWVHLAGARSASSPGGPGYFIGHIQDISAQKAEEDRMREIASALESQANNDPLTSLLNRRGLAKVLRSQISQSQRSGSQLVSVLVDCDNFKQVNDLHGHAAGDAVLCEVARRLSVTLRPTDWVARIGGDEFLLLLPDTRIAEGLHVAEKLRRRIAATPIRTQEGSHHITASFGAAAVSPDVASIEEILRCTHDALSRSKLRGKNRVHGSAEHVHTGLGEPGGPPLSPPADEPIEEVRSGQGFRTVVQPIWDLKANTVIGFEMLSRGPKGALEKPDELFRLCMDARILTDVDLLCLRRALERAGRLDRERRVHVNLFPSTIMDAEIGTLVALFAGTGAPERFCLEISEQQLVGDPAALLERTQRLKAHGVEIAVDDVGFGRSSLETLIVLEPDVIKIDRSMVTGVSGAPGLRRSLDRLMQISRGLDARLIAEGIETRADRMTLLDMGVSAGQGFLWGKPYHLR